jgi:hypothetical protein
VGAGEGIIACSSPTASGKVVSEGQCEDSGGRRSNNCEDWTVHSSCQVSLSPAETNAPLYVFHATALVAECYAGHQLMTMRKHLLAPQYCKSYVQQRTAAHAILDPWPQAAITNL